MNPIDNQSKIAYFCAEFGLSDILPIYSGGLGVLAGDVIREASQENFPLVGVGLFYHQGYFRQWIVNGQQHEVYENIDPIQAGLELVHLSNDQPLIVDLWLGTAPLYAQVWRYQLGTINIYLLDTNINQNREDLRAITAVLYGGDVHTRIQQEIVLGIGGVKVLQALGYKPDKYHLNEGHSAFAIFELISQTMKLNNLDFKTALNEVRKKIVFTNHTLVAAGNDIFTKYDLSIYFNKYGPDEHLQVDQLLNMGQMPENNHLFAMTELALAVANKTNAVSRLHSVMAKKVWPQFNLIPITNGVNLPFWISGKFQEISPNFDSNIITQLPDEKLWEIHQDNKQKLIDEITISTGVTLKLDQPIIVWARRFAEYKRPELLFSDIDRLKRILESTSLPFQIIIAGKAHPSDAVGKNIIKDINEKIANHELGEKVVFLPHYNMSYAKFLTAGADVWLNTPTRGHEASGTSGMKAGGNGTLLCSTQDGWMDEVNWQNIGWTIDDNPLHHLYQLLEDEILPTYYQKADLGYSKNWLTRMKATIQIVWQQYSSKRMFRQYQQELYGIEIK